MSDLTPQQHNDSVGHGLPVSLLRHILQYLFAIYDGWVSLVSGLAGVVLLVLVIFWGDHYPVLRDNKKTFVWTAIICLIVGGFAAWRKERQKWERLGGSNHCSNTPKEIVGVFDHRTTVQGAELAKHYRGKWMTLSGDVADVKARGFIGKLLTPQRAITVQLKKKGNSEPSLILWFNRKRVRHLSALSAGDAMKVLGQIDTVGRSHIWLCKCELIEVKSSTRKE